MDKSNCRGGGDADKAKALYIRMRFAELKNSGGVLCRRDALKPSLLDHLREQSEVVRAAAEAARRPVVTAQQNLSRRLWHVFQWLEEAVQYLCVIRPAVTREFRLTDALTIDQPKFDHGFVSFRRQGLRESEPLDYVALQYLLAGDESPVIRVGINAAAAMDELLRTSMLKFHYQTEEDNQGIVRYGAFRVQPKISASVLVRPDYLRQVVNVTLRNVDRFDSVVLEFLPDALGESALEDLVRCALGSSDRFLHLAPVALVKQHGKSQDRTRIGSSDLAATCPRALVKRSHRRYRRHSPTHDLGCGRRPASEQRIERGYLPARSWVRNT